MCTCNSYSAVGNNNTMQHVFFFHLMLMLWPTTTSVTICVVCTTTHNAHQFSKERKWICSLPCLGFFLTNIRVCWKSKLVPKRLPSLFLALEIHSKTLVSRLPHQLRLSGRLETLPNTAHGRYALSTCLLWSSKDISIR